MPTFAYVAKDAVGNIIRGRREADHYETLANQSADEGYAVTEITLVVPARSSEDEAALDQTAAQFISPEEVKTFTRQLVEMLNEGQFINTALGTLARQQQNGHLQQVLSQVNHYVGGGESFGKALGQYPNVFGRDYITKVQQAEQSGSSRDLLIALSALAGIQVTDF